MVDKNSSLTITPLMAPKFPGDKRGCKFASNQETIIYFQSGNCNKRQLKIEVGKKYASKSMTIKILLLHIDNVVYYIHR